MTQTVDITESAFCNFLANVRARRINVDDWMTFTATALDGYPSVEPAKKILLDAAAQVGQSERCLVPTALSDVAYELLVSLDENYE